MNLPKDFHLFSVISINNEQVLNGTDSIDNGQMDNTLLENENLDNNYMDNGSLGKGSRRNDNWNSSNKREKVRFKNINSKFKNNLRK
jgi:hypothetical protein